MFPFKYIYYKNIESISLYTIETISILIMPVTENQRKAQAKYLSNPENRQKKNEWNREYLKTYIYERTDEQKQRNRIAALARYKKQQEKMKVCEELLKYKEIQEFMARMKEKDETAEMCETAVSKN
jgi:hypothetical protein